MKKMKQTFVGKDFYSQGTLEREKVDSKETIKFPPKLNSNVSILPLR